MSIVVLVTLVSIVVIVIKRHKISPFWNLSKFIRIIRVQVQSGLHLLFSPMITIPDVYLAMIIRGRSRSRRGFA